MSNSPLVNYTKISPYKNSPRNRKISGIAIHCMAGNLSVQTCGNVFQNSVASSNYGIDENGNIGMYVEEKDRAWCTASSYVDNRSVSIEVANYNTPDCKVSDTALKTLINLCVDICKRNGIKKMYWFGNRTDSENYDCKEGEGIFFVHRWYSPKACPGDYLMSKHPYICNEVNKRLANGSLADIVPIEPINCNMHVKDLQYALNEDGIKDGRGIQLEEDGIYGTNTEAAVKKICLSTKTRGRYTNTTSWVQCRVGASVDGIFGDATTKKVKEYQSKKRLTSDGIVGFNTMKALLKDCGVNV